MMISKDTKFKISHEGTTTAAFAAEEFEKHIRQIFGIHMSMPVVTAEGGVSVYIGKAEWCAANAPIAPDSGKLRFDGFYVDISAETIVISGSYDRSLLFGVYSLLEEIGCRWFYPGELGFVVPRLETASFAERKAYVNPDYELRGFSEDTHNEPADIWTTEMLELIDWMCKTGCNSLYVLSSILRFPATWDIVLAELKKRDMVVEIGTHCVHDLIPRELFETRPELFRMKDGVRSKDGNFCVSNEEAMAMVCGSVKAVAAANPGVDIFHLWFDDVLSGSWCGCEKCGSMTAGEQSAKVIKAIAGAVSDVRPDLKIDTLLYHDTVDALKIAAELPANVIGFYAPRERCYSHGIGDEACDRNAFYYKYLKHAVEKFGTENTYVFEYYDDIILFQMMKINIPGTISSDLKQYRQAGVNKITSLMFGRHAWWTYEFNMAAYALAAWDTGSDIDAALRDMCEKLYHQNAEKMIEFYNKLEEASIKLLTFCDYDNLKMTYDIKNLLPEPVEFFVSHTESIKEAGKIFGECVTLLESLAPGTTLLERERIEAQKLSMEIGFRQVKAVILQMTARAEFAGGARDYARIRELMSEAMQIELDLEQWIKTVPYYIKGVASGKIFERMCNDQFRVHRRMSREMLQGN